ncbi:MAG: hypothetical protein K6G80_11610 [Treponema sp.]|nr:hypothetical protein [Treponema sp.]
MLVGTESGLYRILSTHAAVPLWTDAKVTKIIHIPASSSAGERWYFLTAKGIVTSSDLVEFEYRNNGLPFLTIKEYDGSAITFHKQIHQLKDLSVHPSDANLLVTATKDNVFLTRDGGLTWKNIGSMSTSTAGIKAVAVASMNVPGTGKAASVAADGTVLQPVAPERQLAVFMSHPIFGFSYILPDAKKPVWTDVNKGFVAMPGQSYADEIADILPVVFTGSDGFLTTEIFVSQSYLPRIYRFDWAEKRAIKLYTGTEPADTIDALFWDGSQVLYSRPGAVAAFNPVSGKDGFVPHAWYQWKSALGALAANDTLYAAHVPDGGSGIDLGELWLLRPGVSTGAFAKKAADRRAVYVPANHVTTQGGIDNYKKLLRTNGLNALVIDMKDDYGLLRYETQDPLIKEKGYVSRYHIDLPKFVSEFKKDDVYLVARIVTFKDKNLSKYANGKYAVWDRVNKAPWVGTKGLVNVTDEVGNVTGQKMEYYDENWVDPYSPEVWEYNVHIAQELLAGGFDEVQFDYIRFPTDGRNMANASFRYQSEGMDKESALVSFLAYAREHIDAPIGIDIYGANGWYRSGTRTGQDVELLAEYVDVICPMFYPSHFEQSFLNYAPYSERPYRIYYYGTYRNTVIGRNRIIVRPWVQAFYIGVSYDRQYYGKNYVQQQIYGVRDSVGKGYMYWNNIGRYDDILPDIGSSVYSGPALEAQAKFRHPALSGGDVEESAIESVTADAARDVSVLDSVRAQELREAAVSEKKQLFPSLSDIRKLWQAYESTGS